MLKIRGMQEIDLDLVTSIENSVATTPWNKQQFSGCIKAYNSFVIINNYDYRHNFFNSYNFATIIGYGVIAIYSSISQAQILNLGVAASWQGRGIGSTILKYLIDLFIFQESINNINDIDSCLVNKKEVNKIFLEVNKNNQIAINLYQKFGFITVGVRKNYYKTKNGFEDALLLRY